MAARCSRSFHSDAVGHKNREVSVLNSELEQIVSNLLGSATKYTKPGGRIEASLQEAKGEAHPSVKDNGIGCVPTP